MIRMAASWFFSIVLMMAGTAGLLVYSGYGLDVFAMHAGWGVAILLAIGGEFLSALARRGDSGRKVLLGIFSRVAKIVLAISAVVLYDHASVGGTIHFGVSLAMGYLAFLGREVCMLHVESGEQGGVIS